VAPILIAFLVWLFATGKYSDWANIIGVNTGGATGSWGMGDTESESKTASSNSGTDYGKIAESVKTIFDTGGGGNQEFDGGTWI
jgi:hypothetical protein